MTLPLATRREFMAALASGTLAAAFPSTRADAAANAPATSWRGYERATVIDALGGPGSANKPGAALDASDLADVRASGITAVNLTVGRVGSYVRDYDGAIESIAHWDSEIAAHPDVLMKLNDARDFAAAKKSRRLAIIYGFQDATPFGEDLDRLDTFHGLGVRIVQLTYNRRNLVGDGCLEPGDAGLSTFGRDLVERMNARNVLVDLSHCGRRTTDEAIASSKKPVAITHAGCAAVSDLPRNKNDKTLRALAERGGVVGIYLMPYLRTSGQPMAEDVIAHIEHALDVAGEDHVGLGTDGMISTVQLTDEYKKAFADEIAERKARGVSAPGETTAVYTFVPDLNSPRRLETIAALLSKRGKSDRAIEKVLGGNFLRLFTETWPA
ncbi:MAG TPA: membrane dipeptidase [Rhodanobacteraceae bacterium]|nr:membrane dipeptidase [Rhodanobacteraceae bacterium]